MRESLQMLNMERGPHSVGWQWSVPNCFIQSVWLEKKVFATEENLVDLNNLLLL